MWRLVTPTSSHRRAHAPSKSPRRSTPPRRARYAALVCRHASARTHALHTPSTRVSNSVTSATTPSRHSLTHSRVTRLRLRHSMRFTQTFHRSVTQSDGVIASSHDVMRSNTSHSLTHSPTPSPTPSLRHSVVSIVVSIARSLRRFHSVTPDTFRVTRKRCHEHVTENVDERATRFSDDAIV